MALPTDVVDHILSFLQSDAPSLKTCSQSHPILSRLAERHLYASVTVLDEYLNKGSGNSGENCFGAEELIEILSNNPHIAHHVRNLKIKFSDDEDSDEKRHSIVCYFETITLVLPPFSSLQRLDIIQTCDYATFPWRDLPYNFHLAFMDILSLPSMEKVAFKRLAIDVSWLYHYAYVIGLLSFSWCDLESFDPLDDSYDTPILKSLSLENCGAVPNIVDWLQTLPLRVLRVDAGYTDYSSIFPKILSACSSSLTTLDLDFRRQFQSRYEFPTNSRDENFLFVGVSLPFLERLILRAKMHYKVFSKEGQLTWTLYTPLPVMLQLIKSSPSLKQLFIDFQYGFKQWGNNYAPDFFLHANDVWFPILDLATECHPRFKTLISVRWYLEFGMSYDLVLSSIAGCAHLTQLVEQGVVDVKQRGMYDNEALDTLACFDYDSR